MVINTISELARATRPDVAQQQYSAGHAALSYVNAEGKKVVSFEKGHTPFAGYHITKT